MSFDETQLTQLTLPVTSILGDDIKWRWEERLSAMLSEFARDKKEQKLETLRHFFQDEWDKKSIKHCPKALTDQLGTLAKLTKDQLIFSLPASQNQPTLVAMWWPWGHGGTYSVRIIAFKQGYEYDNSPTKRNIFSRLKLLFS